MATQIDKRTKEYRDSRPDAFEQVAGAGIEAKNEVIDKIIITAASKDFDHCPKCGVELLEDEKSSKCEAHCRSCIWENA